MLMKILIIIFLISITIDIFSKIVIIENNDKTTISLHEYPKKFSIFDLDLNYIMKRISTSSIISGIGIAIQTAYFLSKVS